MKKALIVWGGWEGHQPKEVADLFRQILEVENFKVTVSDSMDAFRDEDLTQLSLIIPVITMATILPEQVHPVLKAVREHGVGIAGCHGGMCDAFRTETEWHFMTGGQWVAHPGDDGVTYWVDLIDPEASPITAGLRDFEVTSEQYYLHVDPGVHVLATCDFPTKGVDGPHAQNPCKMPTIWTKHYGKGRVFYNALGHNREVLEQLTPREIMRRGFLWAAL